MCDSQRHCDEPGISCDEPRVGGDERRPAAAGGSPAPARPQTGSDCLVSSNSEGLKTAVSWRSLIAQSSSARAGHRLGEQEALQLVAAHLHQDLLLALVLDPLGDDLQAERVRELDDGVDDRPGVGAVLEVHDEAAVDLQLLGRELAQVGQARVAGAEVVDREVRAELAEAAEGRLGASWCPPSPPIR